VKRRNILRRGNSWVVHKRIAGRQTWASFETLAEAELHLASLIEQDRRGTYRRPVKIQFCDFADEWLTTYAKPNVRQRTYSTYEAALRNHLVPAFGSFLLTEITRRSIDTFVADWLAGGPQYQARLREARARERREAIAAGRTPRPIRLGRSPGTISNALTPMREMLGHAVEWEYLSANPAARVKRPRVPRQEMKMLSAAEVRALLAALPTEWQTFYLVLVMTGVRTGEARAVRWSDIDWEARRLWVRRTINRKGEVEETKTPGSVRAVAIPPTLLRALKRHRMASSFKAADDLVFCSASGAPVDDCNLRRRVFVPALERAGLPSIRQHDLRHTFVSLLINEGVHLKLISEQVGHTSIRTTADRYAHVLAQSYADAADLLDAAIQLDETTLAIGSTT
jgi:integrase